MFGLKWIFASSFCGVLMVFFQLNLSKKQGKWLGILLPGAFLCFGAFLAFDSWDIIKESPETIIYPLLIGGIPASMFTLIYIKTRKKFCIRD